jgi:hypothetical protein
MKKTKAKRKLVSESVLKEVISREHLGVPLTKIIDQLGLDISRPSLRKLITYYSNLHRITENTYGGGPLNVRSSLFPVWLQEDVQEQPDNFTYVGMFPWGMWVYD